MSELKDRLKLLKGQLLESTNWSQVDTLDKSFDAAIALSSMNEDKIAKLEADKKDLQARLAEAVSRNAGIDKGCVILAKMMFRHGHSHGAFSGKHDYEVNQLDWRRSVVSRFGEGIEHLHKDVIPLVRVVIDDYEKHESEEDH